MSSIKSSPKIGQSCATCIRDFTVHFRRPYEIGMPSDNYNGEFGFDWVRDEYIYPLLNIDGGKETVMDLLGEPPLVHRQLYKVLYHEVNSYINTPKRYFPSWLYIFASGCKGVYGSEEINKLGVCLDIEIHQEYIEKNDQGFIDEKEALTDNGTVLVFESSSEFVKISTFTNNQNTKVVEESLSNFINTSRKFIKLGYEEKDEINRYFYKKSNAITISCTGGVLDRNEHIKVIAKRNGSPPRDVGIIYIAQNDFVNVASIVEIDVKVNGEVLKKSKNYELELRNNFFNQSLSIFKVVKKEVFDLDLLSKTDPEVGMFIKKWWNDELKTEDGVKYLEVVEDEDSIIDVNIQRRKNADPTEIIYSEFIRELKELYWRKKWVGLLSPYSDSERNTYIFFAPIYVRHPPKSKDEWNFILGSASFKAHSNILYSKGKYSNDEEFSNAVVIFKDGISYGFLETYAHELGHALGLTHTFESNGMFKFHQGYTDNLMDYPHNKDNIISKYNGKLNVLSKYQIDMIRHNSRIGGVFWPWKWAYI